MTTHFFSDKPIPELLGPGVEARHLNDNCLGRCLNKIANYGVTKLLSEVAFEIAQEQNVLPTLLHLDSTSFSLSGDYVHANEESLPRPCHGYSKDHRADLKQVMLSLTQGGAANLPLWIEPQDGNTRDKTSFQETVKRVQAFMACIEDAPDNLCFVVDSAFYVPEKLAQLENVYWITRVPSTLNAAKAVLTKPTSECH